MGSNDRGMGSADPQRKVIPYELGFGTFILSALGGVIGIVVALVGVEDSFSFFIDCCGIGSILGLSLDLMRLKYHSGPIHFLPAAARSDPASFEDVATAEASPRAATAGAAGYGAASSQAKTARAYTPPRSARAAAVDADDDFGNIPTPVPPRSQQVYSPPPYQSYAGQGGVGGPAYQQRAQSAAAAAHARRQQEQQEKRRRFATCFARAFLFVARADGVTRPSEMAVVDRFFTQKLGFRAADEQLLDRALSEAETNLGTIETLCAEIRRELNRAEILTLFNGLYDVATIDGDLGKSESAIISQLADMLGVTNAELRQIRALFVPEAPEHYALLGLMPEASVSEIKSAFHRAVLENHPDRVAHLGEQAARMATQRFLEVQKAYEAIRQERGF